MKTSHRFHCIVIASLAGISSAFLSEASYPQTANHLVISEVQIGAASAGEEFIEIFNPTDAAIDLSALPLKMHIRNSTGTDVNKSLTFISTIIPSRGWFLIGSNSYGGLSFDATYSSSSSALVSNGGVYISTSASQNVGVIDMVGWGAHPIEGCEGTACPNIPASQSIARKPGGSLGNGIDSDDNVSDFLAPSAATTPRNSRDTPLPVELVYLNVGARKGTAHLRWSTATEINNFGFCVERRAVSGTQSSDARRGNAGFVHVGFVHGAGTSNAPHEYNFFDHTISVGIYAYRLKQLDINGAFHYSGEAEVVIPVPNVFTLNQNYPNPFNPRTTIRYQLPTAEVVVLKIFDVLGKEVATIVNEAKEAGNHEVTFNGEKCPAGIYFYRLRAGSFTETKRFISQK